MAGDDRFRELIVGIEGLALLRNAVDGDAAFRRRRLAEIRHFVAEAPEDDDRPAAAMPAEVDPSVAYRAWSASYDALPNSVIESEEPLVRALLDELAPGRALDVACGTGRYASLLAARGHDTTGVDQSAEMLAVAREKVPAARFEVGDLERLPFGDGGFDLAVCALALTHLPDISTAVAELARVVRHGGRVIISDNHPMTVLLQTKLLFAPVDGQLAFMRLHVHLVGRWLEVFEAYSLRVRSCHEPLFAGRLPPGGFEESIADAARAAWDGIPTAIVWDLERAP